MKNNIKILLINLIVFSSLLSAGSVTPVLGLRLRQRCLEMLRFRERIDTMTDNQRAELDALIAKLGDAAIFDREDWASLV